MYYRTRIGLFCYVVLITMAIVVNGQSLVDCCRREEIKQADGTVNRPRGSDDTGEADPLGDAFQQVAQGLQRLQDALRLQEQRAAAALRQERDEALAALRHALSKGLLQANAPSNEGEAAAEAQLSVQQLGMRVAKLEGIVQRVLERMAIEDPEKQEEEPSFETPISPSSVLSSSSQSTVLPYHSNALTTTSAVPFPLSTVLPSPSTSDSFPSSSTISSHHSPTQKPHAATTVEEPTEEEMKRRVKLRVAEVMARIARSKASLPPLGERLCRAVWEERQEVLLRLLDAGADVNHTCSIGKTPLLLAITFSYRRCDDAVANVAELLLERGADVNAVDEVGKSALHYAAGSPRDPAGRCVALLLSAGADANARDEHGATPLHYAAHSDKAVSLLLAAGAKKNVRGWSGMYKDETPLDMATLDAVRALLRE